VAYSPLFVDQVQAGKYRLDRQPTIHFATEIPTFANQGQVAALLRANWVVINAKPPKEGQSFITSLIRALLPILLIVGLFVFIARSAAGGLGGGVTSFGKARARLARAMVGQCA
jgi:cell division protease FtsH